MSDLYQELASSLYDYARNHDRVEGSRWIARALRRARAEGEHAGRSNDDFQAGVIEGLGRARRTMLAIFCKEAEAFGYDGEPMVQSVRARVSRRLQKRIQSARAETPK